MQKYLHYIFYVFIRNIIANSSLSYPLSHTTQYIESVLENYISGLNTSARLWNRMDNLTIKLEVIGEDEQHSVDHDFVLPLVKCEMSDIEDQLRDSTTSDGVIETSSTMPEVKNEKSVDEIYVIQWIKTESEVNNAWLYHRIYCIL